MTYEELLEKARETYESEDTPHVVKAWLLANIIYPTDKSEDDRIRKGLIKAFGTIGKKDWGGLIVGDILAWLEKQGEQHSPADINKMVDNAYLQGVCDAKHEIEKQGKKLDADKVIEWMRQHLCTACWDEPNEAISLRIGQFKKDFGL